MACATMFARDKMVTEWPVQLSLVPGWQQACATVGLGHLESGDRMVVSYPTARIRQHLTNKLAEWTGQVAPVGDDLRKPYAEERNLEELLAENLGNVRIDATPKLSPLLFSWLEILNMRGREHN